MCPEKNNIDNQLNEPELASYELINGLGLINKVLPKLREICNLYHVQKLELFGSAVKGPFTQKSDVDFLVRFSSIPLKDYFENFINFKISLEKLLIRKVDLLEEQTLNNPHLIESINRDKLRIWLL